MKRHTEKLYQWALNKASSRKAPLWMGLLFALEVALFIPLDAVLIFFCLQDRKKIPLFVAMATVASLLSGLIGYLLGHFLWDLIGPYVVPGLIPLKTFQNFSQHLQQYEHGAIFFGALLPLPMKAVSLISGIFQFGILPFATYLFLGRVVRFSLTGIAMAFWGEKVKAFVDRHFHKIFVALGAKMAAIFMFFWVFAK